MLHFFAKNLVVFKDALYTTLGVNNLYYVAWIHSKIKVTSCDSHGTLNCVLQNMLIKHHMTDNDVGDNKQVLLASSV